MNWELLGVLTLIGATTLHIRSVAVMTSLLWAAIALGYLGFYWLFPLKTFLASGITFLIACIATGAATLVQKVHYQRPYDGLGFVETRTGFYYGFVLTTLLLVSPAFLQ